YFLESLAIASRKKNDDFIGTSMVGLGEVYLKQKKYGDSRNEFLSAIPYLSASKNEDLLSETYYGLAILYDSLGTQRDSARHYASKMLSLAQKDGFLRWQVKAAEFLNAFYKKNNRIDSAYTYLVLAQQLHDSINNNEKIRQLQVISSNEQLRQSQLAEQKRIA